MPEDLDLSTKCGGDYRIHFEDVDGGRNHKLLGSEKEGYNKGGRGIVRWKRKRQSPEKKELRKKNNKKEKKKEKINKEKVKTKKAKLFMREKRREKEKKNTKKIKNKYINE